MKKAPLMLHCRCQDGQKTRHVHVKGECPHRVKCSRCGNETLANIVFNGMLEDDFRSCGQFSFRGQCVPKYARGSQRTL